MTLQHISKRLSRSSAFKDARDWCTAAYTPSVLRILNAAGSLPAFFLAELLRETDLTVLVATPSEDLAAYLYSDLEQLTGTDTIARFPGSGVKPYDTEQVPDTGLVIHRTDTLQRMAEEALRIVIGGAASLYERVPGPETLQGDTVVLTDGETLSPDDLVRRLTEQGFVRVEFVEQPGDLAVRGGIIDVYPYSGQYPVRIEFFGEQIDSLREFDPKTQRSVSRMTAARLVPNLEKNDLSSGGAVPLLTYLPENTLVVTYDEPLLIEGMNRLYQQALEGYLEMQSRSDAETPVHPAERYWPGDDFRKALSAYRRVQVGTYGEGAAGLALDFGGVPQPSFSGSVTILKKTLIANAEKGRNTLILCDSPGQETRILELLEESDPVAPCSLQVESIHEGFEVPAERLAVYTDHQIFNRYHRPTTRRRKKPSGGMSMREIQDLSPGDFVVHIDYGIGKFAGMERITIRGKHQDAVRVLFADNDLLYVNVNALYKLHKYSGKEGHKPRLTKLGSGQWERTRSKAKKRVKDIARDLISLYSRRKATTGHAFPDDTIWQRELEARFEFEDTPDQASAADAVKRDMEQPAPMDRLVCGDVGFGKTEVAVRAAFKAVQDGKQAAVLVPTTILAEQHYETFSRRLGPYPVRIEALSRFRTAKEQKEIIQRIASGEVDVVIGTHRLVSKDVRFKNLGLLVIDEEQRFGVSVKERLRQMRAEVDTLTLTATPIPRTLQFSLLGARDLSIICTPPPNRQPIVTEIHTFDRTLVRDAILYETSRGGQVFFIHNRVQSIEEIAVMLREQAPNVRIQVAHGQMKPRDLENVMLGFVEKKFDVLVSTNIIESGLDISNANTIIINNADHFGLSELHQLRGRVGRSDRKAFCYLLVPSIHTLTREARQRLQAVEEFSELGSGFNIAMRDMDIRGAGNLLGAEQTGFIEDVGYETYHRILDEAVQELRTEEFADVFAEAPAPQAQEASVEIDADAFIPESYVSNNVERLNVYRRISEAGAEESLHEVRTELRDRFGPLPVEVEHLFEAAQIKLLAQRLRLTKVSYKNERLFLDFPSPEADAYFYGRLFHPMLEKLTSLPNRYVLRDTNRKLRVIIQDVPSIDSGQDLLHLLAEGLRLQLTE